MRLKQSRYGLFYSCTRFPECRGTHGAHANGTPLSVPGTPAVKHARMLAHEAFDRMWRGPNSAWTRNAAYLWMADVLGLDPSEAHIGRFTEEQCNQLIEFVEKELRI